MNRRHAAAPALVELVSDNAAARGLSVARQFANSMSMKPHRALAPTHCPNCGARIVPTPKELKQWRLAADLTQRQIAARLKISAAHVAYLENGKRSPSATVIARYWKFKPQ